MPDLPPKIRLVCLARPQRTELPLSQTFDPRDPQDRPADDLTARLEALSGRKVATLSRPGGKDRAVIRVRFTEGPGWILSQRPASGAAARERTVLTALARIPGTPAPQLVGQLGQWTIVSDLGQTKLSVRLQHSAHSDRWPMIDRALRGMLEVQDAANRSGVALHLPRIDMTSEAIAHAARGPTRTRKLFGLPGPVPDTDALEAALAVARPKFVKWDARAANIVVAEDGALGFIDFELSGLRHGCEDLAWLLCDETLPIDLAPHLDAINTVIRDYRAAAPEAYLRSFTIYAALQAGVRLRVIRNELRKKAWTPLREILTSDRVGAHPDLAERLARNGAAFADLQPETRPMVAMFHEIEAQVRAARRHEAPE